MVIVEGIGYRDQDSPLCECCREMYITLSSAADNRLISLTVMACCSIKTLGGRVVPMAMVVFFAAF